MERIIKWTIALFLILLVDSHKVAASSCSENSTHTCICEPVLREDYVIKDMNGSLSLDALNFANRDPIALEPKETETKGSKLGSDGHESDLYPPGSEMFYLNLIFTFVCVSGAALAAGLTMGLVSQDPMELSILLETEEEDCATLAEQMQLSQEKAYARNILPLISRHHLLLVTLLLLNSLANEAMPVFLETIVPSYIAVILSTTFVLIFCEVVPSALFTGPEGLRYASFLAPLVWLFVAVFFIVAWPISLVLDRIFGDESEINRYNKAKLKALIRLHAAIKVPVANETTPLLLEGDYASTVDLQRSPDSGEGHAELTEDEMMIIHGAMELHHAKVSSVMTPLSAVFMLNVSDTLSQETLARVVASGRSRIPVCADSAADVRGYLVTKRLVAVYPSEERLVGSLALRQVSYVRPDSTLSACLKHLQREGSHMAMVARPRVVDQRSTRPPGPAPTAVQHGTLPPPDVEIVGLVTIMDILKTMITTPMKDEDDAWRSVSRALRPTPRMLVDDAYFGRRQRHFAAHVGEVFSVHVESHRRARSAKRALQRRSHSHHMETPSASLPADSVLDEHTGARPASRSVTSLNSEGASVVQDVAGLLADSIHSTGLKAPNRIGSRYRNRLRTLAARARSKVLERKVAATVGTESSDGRPKRYGMENP